MLELLTGTGLAASAGLNAYIPLLLVGLLNRYTSLVELPSGWQWLSNGWVIGILVVLLAIEVVADKVPVVDHVNDAVQTFVRPTAGGLAFGAGSTSETVSVSDPGQFFSSNQWVPIALGVAIAQPKRHVIALEGDGSLLMQLGCLATVAERAPKNLT
ncbi:MAG TPA: DUF4126 family protein, partial [Micromonosporaceae bacterium]|nr:DUF4126 family protein [Micromonosporaceae bacterium]